MFRTSAFRLKSIIDDIDLKGGKKKQLRFEVKIGRDLACQREFGGRGCGAMMYGRKTPNPKSSILKIVFRALSTFLWGWEKLQAFSGWFCKEMTDDQPVDLSCRSPPSRVWADVVCVRTKFNSSGLSGISTGRSNCRILMWTKWKRQISDRSTTDDVE